VKGTGGGEKLFFTGKKAETSASVYCLPRPPPLSRRSLVRRRIHFSKKAAYFVERHFEVLSKKTALDEPGDLMDKNGLFGITAKSKIARRNPESGFFFRILFINKKIRLIYSRLLATLIPD